MRIKIWAVVFAAFFICPVIAADNEFEHCRRHATPSGWSEGIDASIKVARAAKNMFFVTLIEDVGWPFQDKRDSAALTDWQRVFNPSTLKQIVDFEWECKELTFDSAMFWRESFGDVEAVRQRGRDRKVAGGVMQYAFARGVGI